MLTKIITSVEFWKIVTPAIIAIATWYSNEKSKRIQHEYERKEDRYKELLCNLRGFYASLNDPKLKTEFLNQLNLCWLYAPDEVIKKAYEFLGLVNTDAKSNDSEKELALGELVVEIRKDLMARRIVKNSNLKPEDFKNLIAN